MGRSSPESRPGFARWRAVQVGEGLFAVWRPDGTRYGSYSTFAQAVGIAEDRQKADDARARKMERRCMCCREQFWSDGLHNRLCSPCRGRSAEGSDSYSLAPRSGRPR